MDNFNSRFRKGSNSFYILDEVFENEVDHMVTGGIGCLSHNKVELISHDILVQESMEVEVTKGMDIPIKNEALKDVFNNLVDNRHS